MADTLDQLLNDATDIAGDNLIYINTTRFTVTPNEVFIDLYHIAPSAIDPATPSAKRMTRVVMPLASAKEFAEKLLEGVGRWEEATGINLPMKSPADVEQDT